MTGDRTESIAPDGRQRTRVEWALVVALDCQALSTWPQRFSLAGETEISIGRGSERRLERTPAHTRLDLPDRWISENHARLLWSANRWSIKDEGSRNGTRVNGERLERATLNDGDVIECGGTYLVLRRTDAYRANPEPLAERPEALRTLSPALDHELGMLRKVALSPVPVLLLGESGTGKEGMAAVIHALSGRAGRFLALNCGAIPSTLIESELFGSRRGAFSGAEDRLGLVVGAEGGTLFLDEVAELPLSSQAALLRVLQEKEVLPLGAARPIAVDVRVVAATNQPVDKHEDEHKLRRDLYARLCGYQLRLPRLRDRREDLGLIVAALIARHDKSGAPRTLSRAAASALFAHAWPFNIRELEQCIAAALAVASEEIGLDHLPRVVRESAAARRIGAPGERDHLIAVIQKHRGNLSAAARDLGTSRSQLYRMLARLAIGPDDTKSTP